MIIITGARKARWRLKRKQQQKIHLRSGRDWEMRKRDSEEGRVC